jgi:hypothetical protein
VVDGDSIILARDSAGALFNDVGQARKQAVRLARDFAMHGFKGQPENWKLVVCDQGGVEVLTIPLSQIRWRKLRLWLDFLLLNIKRRFRARALLAAAISLILVHVAVTSAVIMQNAGKYQTASAPTDGSIMAVRFIPHASMSEITIFLKRYDATIVGGPLTGGLYRIRITRKNPTQDQLTELIGRMTKDEIVELAATVQ